MPLCEPNWCEHGARRAAPNATSSRAHYTVRRTVGVGALVIAVSALALFQASPARAQEREHMQRPRANPPPQSQYIPCATPGQPLLRIPELVSNENDHILRGTVLLTDTAERVDLGIGSGNCVPQFMRNFQGVNAVLPGYAGTIPPGFPGAEPPPPPVRFVDPVPGPTLRAKLGDIVELTFLNQMNPGDYGDSIDRGERGQGCDESSAPYPGLDTFPDCFHGSSTGNIHFHGTHTSPSTTGDDVFIEVRPSLRGPGGPLVTEQVIRSAFDKFFTECTLQLKKNVLSQWPKSWSDFPPELVVQQLSWLAEYDSDPAIQSKLLPVDLHQWAQGAWPQYYIGAFPYCFQLPEYKEKTWPPAGSMQPASHGPMMEHPEPPLIMGQSPGTHWYHAHKHGSTTIDVDNGMTGAFIIEGGYDKAFDGFYGDGWTRKQPVMVLNQLDVGPNLAGGGAGPLPFSVNGRPQPTVQMRPGEVQLWRIANTSSRSGAYFIGPPNGFQWRQTAQDGVQFPGTTYWDALNQPFLMAAGNRVDLLVKAPLNTTQVAQSFAVQVRQAVNSKQTQTAAPSTLITVVVPPGSAVTNNQSEFIPAANMDAVLPPFLVDIKAGDVKGTKTVVFETANPVPPAPQGQAPFRIHTIDGKKFDGNVGEVVLLNTVEEWKIENRTVAPLIDHPFHIHINPFQVVEVFDPNETLPGSSTNKYIFEGTPAAGQCLLNIDDPDGWKPCGIAPHAKGVWWDVFPIPSGRKVTVGAKTAIVPGYFKMRSRFVDYTGQYVMHCHILAHEDRGMMNVVEVVPFTTPYSHQ